MEGKRSFVRQAVSMYRHGGRVASDVERALEQYGALQPVMETAVTSTGTGASSATAAAVLALAGTVPVTYRGTTYNIPMAVQLPLAYPSQPPLCFVRPTNAMVVRQSEHVDDTGRIYHPYLASWSSRPDAASLVELIAALQSVFSARSPVYTRANNNNVNNVNNCNNYNNNVQSPQSNVYARRISPSATAYQNTSPSYSPPYSPSNVYGLPRPPVANAMHHYRAAQQTISSNDAELMALISLRSAVGDKIKRYLSDISGRLTAEMDVALETNKQLIEGERYVIESLKLLQDQKAAVERQASECRSNIDLLKRNIELIQKTPDTDVDDMIVSSDALLLKVVADDHAVEDLFYHLSKAFHSGNVPFGVYMKTIRSLARDQFMSRALTMKIRAVAGLDRR